MGDCILNKTGRRGSHWQGCCYSSRGTWPRVICKNGESDWVDNDMGLVGQSSMLSALSGCYTLCHDGSPANQPLWILLLPPVGQLGKKNTSLVEYKTGDISRTNWEIRPAFIYFFCMLLLFRQYLLWIEAIWGSKIGLEFNLLFKKRSQNKSRVWGSPPRLDCVSQPDCQWPYFEGKRIQYTPLHFHDKSNQIKGYRKEQDWFIYSCKKPSNIVCHSPWHHIWLNI